MEKVSIGLRDPAILQLNLCPKELKTHTETSTRTHRLIAAPDAHSSQTVEATHKPTDGWMKSNEKECIAVYYNMNGPLKCYTKGKKPDTKVHMLYDFNYMKSLQQINQ